MQPLLLSKCVSNSVGLDQSALWLRLASDRGHIYMSNFAWRLLFSISAEGPFFLVWIHAVFSLAEKIVGEIGLTTRWQQDLSYLRSSAEIYVYHCFPFQTTTQPLLTDEPSRERKKGSKHISSSLCFSLHKAHLSFSVWIKIKFGLTC